MSRFDWRFELDAIARGLERDKEQVSGQTVLWYVFDMANTIVDPIWDVGAIPDGRRWKAPVYLPVISAVKLEGKEDRNDQGRYIVDTLQITFSAKTAAARGLADIWMSPKPHNTDRVVYEREVFEVNNVRVRGMLTAGYAICAADCLQVMNEELVNDPQFRTYITG